MNCHTGKIKHTVISGQNSCKCKEVNAYGIAIPRTIGDLLAVIHRDGGHYEGEHGFIKAYDDAVLKVLEAYDRIEQEF